MKKFIVFFGIMSLLVLVFPSLSFADMAPDKPNCAEDMDYSQSPAVQLNPTCGYFSLTTILDLSSYADKFVFLESETCNATTYSVVGPVLKDASGRFNEINFIAVDKDYFTSTGGLSGIFTKRSIPSDGECDYLDSKTVATMEPRDDVAFDKHSYKFVVSKNDLNLDIDIGNLIEQKYSAYYNIGSRIYKPTTDMSCDASTCSEEVVYAPEKIDGQYIVVVPSKINYVPKELANYPAYVEKGIKQPVVSTDTATPQNINPAPSEPQNLVVPPNPAPTPQELPASTPHVSWLQRIWNAIVNFFKKLF